MLSYPREILAGFVATLEGEPLWDIHPDVAFVAIKNGEHNGTGYFVDTGMPAASAKTSFRLAELPDRIFDAFGMKDATRSAVSH